MGIFFFFIDGLGVGKPNENNPVFKYSLFSSCLDHHALCDFSSPLIFPGGIIYQLDARLGVTGIPQSATGQTALFCGLNAAGLAGRHVSAYPDETLVALLKKNSILHYFKNAGKKVSCLNLYRKEYRDKIIADNTLILPASTLMTKYSGTEILTVENHFSSGLYMDIDHHVLHVHYPYIPCADPLEQGRHTAQLVSRHDFSFFEYFLTDTWAHRRSETAIKKIISCLNFFLEGLTESLALERHAVIITSDHGNMEEISINEHTLNPVPLVIITRNEQYLSAVRTVNPVNITDVYRLIVCMHEAENKIA